MNELKPAVRELSVSGESLLALARLDLAAYTVANFPAFELPPFVDLIVRKLEAVERGDIKRLILSLPPRHSKSLLASVYLPAWYLGRHPDRYVIAASYGEELIQGFARKVRNTIADPLHSVLIFPESRISTDSSAAHRFDLTRGGAYYATGRGGAVSGRGAHLLVIDDPLKDAEEARSETIRRNLHDWFRGVAFTRLQPDGAIVIAATRWHELDLTGWLLEEHASQGWEELRLPAIAEDDDPAGRAEGEPLWPERYGRDALDSIKRQIGSAAFASLYQQRPAPVEGRLFRREWWRTYTVPPPDSEIVRTVLAVDSAFKPTDDADYTAMVVIVETRTAFYILHAMRERLSFPDLKRKVIEFAAQWRPNVCVIEDRASGQSLIQELDRDTALPVVGVKANADKATRAVRITPLAEAGKILVPISAGWLGDFIEELSNFPASRHDDFVDALVHGVTYCLETGIPDVY